jgi:hypothetical protein
VPDFARDPAKVVDQVRFLARTMDFVTLKPNGQATACRAVQMWVRLPPASFVGSFKQGLLQPGQRRAAVLIDRISVRAFRDWVMTKVARTTVTWLAQTVEHQTKHLAVAGSTPAPPRRETGSAKSGQLWPEGDEG